MSKKIIYSVSIYCLGIAVIVWIIGFVVFCLYAVSFKFHSDDRADAIVALTGGGARVQKAINLFTEGYADKLLISGVHPSVKLSDLTEGVPSDKIDRITLGYLAQDTRGNAVETVAWLRGKKVHSLILITSFYHMPRSMYEILSLEPDLEILPFPVFPKSFDDSVDWIRTRYAWLLFVEYHKLMATRMHHFFERIFL